MSTDPALEETTVFDVFRQAGSLEQFTIIFSALTAILLLSRRIQGAFTHLKQDQLRDLAFLIFGAVSATTLMLVRAAAVTMSYFGGGMDTDFGLRFGLAGNCLACVVAFFTFVTGVIALMLPRKPARADG